MSGKTSRRWRRRLAAATAAMMAAAVIPPVSGGVPVQGKAAEEPVEFLSAMTYGTKQTDTFMDVAYTNDGGFVAVGYTYGSSSSYGEKDWKLSESDVTYQDGLVVKFDKDHKIQWTKTIDSTPEVKGEDGKFEGRSYDFLTGVDVLKDGRIAVSGRVSYTEKSSKIKGTAMYAGLIDPDDPDQVTAYHIGSSAGDEGCGIAATPDGGFVLGGWTGGQDGYCVKETSEGAGEAVQLWQKSGGKAEGIPERKYAKGSDSVMIRFDKEGEVKFCALENYAVEENAYKITGPSSRLSSIDVDSKGNIYIAGFNNHVKNGTNATMAKFSADGEELWHKSAGTKNMKEEPTDPAEYFKAENVGVTVLSDDSVMLLIGRASNAATTEEAWTSRAQVDTVLVHYKEDGKFVHAESIGTINDENSRMEGLLPLKDGGYLVYGSQAGVTKEDDQIKKGYNWGNYGANDAVIIQYDGSDQPVWAENYGSTGGDWINAMDMNEDGEIIAAGETNGKGGKPNYSNIGGIDGLIMCSGFYEAATTPGEPGKAGDGKVVWADGSYTAGGYGYAGTDSVVVKVTVEGNKIKSVEKVSTKDTKAYYTMAEDLYDEITDKQSADVDAVSGATLSSNGIKEATKNALSQAAAISVKKMIDELGENPSADAVKAAVAAYEELGTYAQNWMNTEAADSYTALSNAASAYKLAIRVKTAEGMVVSEPPETKPELSADQTHNDTYWKLQAPYINSIQGEALRDNGLTGKGVKIAMIDSGLTANSADIDYSKVAAGYDYVNDCPLNAPAEEKNEALIDTNGHGTAVAGLLLGKADNGIGVAGMLSEAGLIPLRVNPPTIKEADLQKDPDKYTEASKVIAQAIRDAVDKYQASVITTSLQVVDTEDLRAAVDYAAEKNVIITGAAGNSGTSLSNIQKAKDEFKGDAYVYPAAYENVISVASVDSKGKVSDSSQKNDQVFAAAPGVDMALLDLSADGKRCKISSGTSYASPMVAAMAAAAKQSRSDITAEQFKEALVTSSTDAGDPGKDIFYGNGIVNCKNFVYDLAAVGKKNIRLLQQKPIADQTYTGSPIEPEMELFDGEKRLVKGTDYTVSYKNNTEAGTAQAVVTGMGSYGGVLDSVTFVILPKQDDPGNNTNPGKTNNDGSKSSTTNTGTQNTATVGSTFTDSKDRAAYKIAGSSEVTMTGIADKKWKKVRVPDTVKYNNVTYMVTAVAANAFKKSSIQSVVIGKNVKTIGEHAFFGCKKLKSVTLGKSVAKIGKNAFKGDKKLSSVKIKGGNTLKTVGKNAFGGVKKKLSVTVYAKNKKIYKKLVKKLKKAGAKKAKYTYKKG